MPGVHRGGLHVLLWQRRETTGVVRVVQKKLAEEFVVSKYSMSRILKTMADEGRLIPLTGSAGTTYEVVDPVAWAARNTR